MSDGKVVFFMFVGWLFGAATGIAFTAAHLRTKFRSPQATEQVRHD